MNKNMVKNFLIIFIIIIILIIGISFSKSSKIDTSKIVETNNQETEVTKETISTTLTAIGEVESANIEKIYLNTSYYYLTMCAEENEFVEEGNNLLEYTNGTYITAPYDCVVIGYSVPTAKSICTSTNYVYIASVEDLYMNININEEQINNISIGQEVEIISNYDETVTYTGTITKINAIGTHNSGGTTFSAIAAMENDGNLKLGMSATCIITIEKLEDVLALPIEAVVIENNQKYVNLINSDGTTELVEIETGKADANYVQIVSGLSEGDKVSYETTTVTSVETEDEDETMSITSLFNFGIDRSEGGKGR